MVSTNTLSRTQKSKEELLFTQGEDWTFKTLRETHDAIAQVAHDELGLDIYPNQIEIISSEQMLDAHSSIGMPVMYRHWSFGKHFIHHERLYRKGARGLAYEIVINSNPCISYNVEENTAALMALVMAHAAFGHNHFFKNNHLFKQWTDAEGILDYLEYGRRYIALCEEKHGELEVERLIDAAHALMHASVFRYQRPHKLSLKEEEARQTKRFKQKDKDVDYLWNALVPSKPSSTAEEERIKRRLDMHLPEENLLYFLEKWSPVLKIWQREILRIVRNIAQYFYPQRQTQIMNEGCACFTHYHILKKLHRYGRIDDGSMLEILHNHTSVLTQPDFDDPRYSGINPYAIGFAMTQDIRRIVTGQEVNKYGQLVPCSPAQLVEDREWFPEIAGTGDWRGVLKDAWANYRDESFIQQFLSPRVLRHFRMFTLNDNAANPYFEVAGIHNEQGYRDVRDSLARSRDVSIAEPDIQVVDVSLLGDRVLHLQRKKRNNIPLNTAASQSTMAHIRDLWGYEVVMEEVPS